MAYKNWDEVRDERIYGYLSTPEHEKFVQAMQTQGISQRGTAVRQFLMDMCDNILCSGQTNHPDKEDNQSQTKAPTANPPHKNGEATVNPVMVNHINFNDLNLSLNLK